MTMLESFRNCRRSRCGDTTMRAHAALRQLEMYQVSTHGLQSDVISYQGLGGVPVPPSMIPEIFLEKGPNDSHLVSFLPEVAGETNIDQYVSMMRLRLNFKCPSSSTLLSTMPCSLTCCFAWHSFHGTSQGHGSGLQLSKR